MRLSICIPTFNRAHCLINCLNSIKLNKFAKNIDFEVCISDNASTDNTTFVVGMFQNDLTIKYFRFDCNNGRVKNYLNAVNMADGDFVWLLGDDDLLIPEALEKISTLIEMYKNVDFFYINSYNLNSDYVFSFPQPFNTDLLPLNMTKFSTYKLCGRMKFIDLINPSISFDFVGAMFLAVFKRKNWMENLNVLNQDAIIDQRTFSHFDNTFPHVKIFAKAFSNSDAYFFGNPLTVNLSGSREWSPMSPLVNIVRLIESLDEYRLNGLSNCRYLQCKNFAYRTFWPDYLRMITRKKESGYEYIHPIKLLLNAMIYPYSWLSPIVYIMDVIKRNLRFSSYNK